MIHLIAAATLQMVNVITTAFQSRSTRAERFFEGIPVVPINHGQPIEANLRREWNSHEGRAAALHEH